MCIQQELINQPTKLFNFSLVLVYYINFPGCNSLIGNFMLLVAILVLPHYKRDKPRQTSDRHNFQNLYLGFG